MKKSCFLLLSVILIVISTCTRSPNLEELKIITDSVNRFAFDFLSQLEPVNNFFSPYSIYNSLALFYEGAEGQTKQQLAKVLYLEDQETGKGMRQLHRELHKRETDGITIKIANALWLDEHIRLKRIFRSRSRRFYNSSVQSLDFRNRADESINTINKWVYDKTEGLISNIISPFSIRNDTKMILTNTICFLGRWADDFSKNATFPSVFYLSPEEACKVRFMNKKSYYSSYETEEFQAIELPYIREELAMIIILPVEGLSLEDFMQSFSYEQYKEIINSYKRRELDVSIPRFEFGSNYRLKDLLSNMGLQDLFGQRADLSGISDVKPGLMLDEMYHKTHIEVKEEGTEVRVTTHSNMALLGFDLKPFFKVNRPFLFIIRDNVSESILFCGTLYNPDPAAEVTSHAEAEHIEIRFVVRQDSLYTPRERPAIPESLRFQGDASIFATPKKDK